MICSGFCADILADMHPACGTPRHLPWPSASLLVDFTVLIAHCKIARRQINHHAIQPVPMQIAGMMRLIDDVQHSHSIVIDFHRGIVCNSQKQSEQYRYHDIEL